MSDDLISWIGLHLLPHERDVRNWLRHQRVARDLEDDVIQEAYCRISSADFRNIANGRSYFFATARNVLIDRIRKDRPSRHINSAEFEFSNVVDEEPSAERALIGRQDYDMVCRMIEQLPPRCRDVFKMRKINQLSQRQTADQLGLSENVVEKEVARGLRLLLAAVAGSDDIAAPATGPET